MPAEPGDELYDAPLAEFTARRDSLAKDLKAAGDRDAAASVKALRRPTTAAWAVNQVARASSGKKDVAALVQLGDRLRDAHDALLEGKGDAAIRELTAERRKLVAKLTKAAVAELGGGGEAQREAITHTFDAAVADPEAALLVRAGRLQKELAAPSGFGGGLVFGDVLATPPARRQQRGTARKTRSPTPAPVSEPSFPTPTDAPATVGARKPAEGTAGATTSAERQAKPSAAERQAAKEAAKAAERRRRQLQRDADDRAAEAQQAAREAAAARQEVSRLQELLVTADAKAKGSADRALRAQQASAEARRALCDAESESP